MKRLFVILLLIFNFNVIENASAEISNFETPVIVNPIENKYNRYLNYFNLDDSYKDLILFIDNTITFYDLNIPLGLFLSLIEVESEFIHNRYSSAGAYGFCQIMKNTEKIINSENDTLLDRKNKFDNIILSVLYLKGLLKRYDNNLEYALRFYNGGTYWRDKKSTLAYYNKIMRIYKDLE